MRYTVIFTAVRIFNFHMINPFFFSQNTPQLGEYPQSMFCAKEDNNMHPCKHKFYYIKVGSICITRRC